ncbi:kinase [Desulfococcaceae bacterium HSG7]|nr:kinase [Desulfococcaceae bacterium HSG7]
MVISKTPFRISFFGGGTDHPEFFEKNRGAVLGSAIDKFIYHSITEFPSKLFDYSIRLAYRKVECVNSLQEIEHAPFREILKYYKIDKDIEIGLSADLPSFSGLGSSSSFSVGLINALNAFQSNFIPKKRLAQLAIHIEREILKESVGCQDQTFAAYGGLNVIEFITTENLIVHRISLSNDRLNELNNSLLLFFTGITRRAADIEKNKIGNLDKIENNLKQIYEYVEKAHDLLTGNKPLSEFGRLLNKTWYEKRNLHTDVSNSQVDRMYKLALEAGALGGKLLGAGGGGFMLFFVPIERQPSVKKALIDYYEIPFSINAPGSHIIHS